MRGLTVETNLGMHRSRDTAWEGQIFRGTKRLARIYRGSARELETSLKRYERMVSQ